MKLNSSLIDVLEPAYHPCPAFSGACKEMRWNPSQGHVPRGFLGGAGALAEIELVLVFAEPGDPHESEVHEGINSAYRYATYAFETGKDQFHRNVRAILDSCWPDLSFEEQLRKVWMTESVLCSAKKECGPITTTITDECGQRYLKKQLELMPNALVVALGRKAQHRLRSIGFTDFLPASAVAPPGCNFSGASESWARIPLELRHIDNAQQARKVPTMQKSDDDAGLFQAFSEKIQNIRTMQAYRYLVGWGLASKEYSCFPKPQGYLNSVRFYRGSSWDFAFIPNQKWLTFYFRRPCLSLAKYTKEEILKQFPDAEETNEGEFIVRLSSLEEALRIASYIES